jgi:lipopolysaccharide export LptBFGC system permease protein LptF
MVKSFDMSKFNSFIQQASDTIMCNSDCQKQKETDKLKQAYEKAQETLASAPSQLQTAEQQYVVYTQGQTTYDELQDRELDEKATVIVDTFKENFDEEVIKIQSQINSYNGLLMNYKNVLELLMKYEKENGELFKDIKKETNDVLTNERKSFYEDQNIGSLKFYYFYFLLIIYVICVLCFAAFSLIYPSQSSWVVRLGIFVLLIVLPFVSTWILGMIIYFIYEGYNLLPKNVYIEKNF